MTGTRPAKMDQNLSNDVQDKTADISGSGRKLTFGMLVVMSLPWGQAGVVASRLSWASLAAHDYQIILLHLHSPDRVTRQQ